GSAYGTASHVLPSHVLWYGDYVLMWNGSVGLLIGVEERSSSCRNKAIQLNLCCDFLFQKYSDLLAKRSLSSAKALEVVDQIMMNTDSTGNVHTFKLYQLQTHLVIPLRIETSSVWFDVVCQVFVVFTHGLFPLDTHIIVYNKSQILWVEIQISSGNKLISKVGYLKCNHLIVIESCQDTQWHFNILEFCPYRLYNIVSNANHTLLI
ncbi:hypothetical protein ACJX0J_009112, partial [Zea mays]